eukprot:TRINITY_DN8490_c0_g1_i1.p1 TRINITY_DN8490_c0_g1~~TRINITY_DN8490_c0_g1_i1.p1  ORF type:complete len:293 (-),score=39.42 TRINITY_DN8490_c0_g1_i1:4-882(-)
MRRKFWSGLCRSCSVRYSLYPVTGSACLGYYWYYKRNRIALCEDIDTENQDFECKISAEESSDFDFNVLLKEGRKLGNSEIVEIKSQSSVDSMVLEIIKEHKSHLSKILNEEKRKQQGKISSEFLDIDNEHKTIEIPVPNSTLLTIPMPIDAKVVEAHPIQSWHSIHAHVDQQQNRGSAFAMYLLKDENRIAAHSFSTLHQYVTEVEKGLKSIDFIQMHGGVKNFILGKRRLGVGLKFTREHSLQTFVFTTHMGRIFWCKIETFAEDGSNESYHEMHVEKYLKGIHFNKNSV